MTKACYNARPTTYVVAAVILGLIFPEVPAAKAASSPEAKIASDKIAPRGKREVKDLTFGDWQKLCFKPGGEKMLCRTSISGKFETGQLAVRLDVIRREGNDAARLQIFVPVGMYLPPGVELSVDGGRTHRIAYIWCLTNGCVAADVLNARLAKDMESGRALQVTFVDTNLLSLVMSLPLERFGAVHKNAPAKIYEQNIEE
jgi:invasion protein IalB